MNKKNYEFTGILIYKSETKTTAKGSQFVEVSIKEAGETQYPQMLVGSLMGATGIQYMQSEIGDTVECRFSLNGRQSQDGRYRASNTIRSIKTIKKSDDLFNSVDEDLPF